MKGWTLTTISRMRLRMKTQPASAPLSVFLLWSGLRIVTVRTSREWKYLSLKNIPIVINHVWYFSKMPVVVLDGAVGLKVGPVIKSLDQIGSYCSERYLLLWTKPIVAAISSQPHQSYQASGLALSRTFAFSLGPRHLLTSLRSESLNSLLSKLKLISLSSGILVVNVQWRGRAYVGALFDSSRQKNINQNR